MRAADTVARKTFSTNSGVTAIVGGVVPEGFESAEEVEVGGREAVRAEEYDLLFVRCSVDAVLKRRQLNEPAR